MTTLSLLALGVGLTLLLFAVAVIAIPIRVAARGALDDTELDGTLQIAWCWGLLELRILSGAEFELLLWGRTLLRRSLPSRTRKKQEPEEKKSGPPFGVLLEHWRALAHILKRLFDALDPHAVISGRIGLSHPEQTAFLALALREIDAVIPGVVIDIDADYVDRSTLLRGVLSAFVWPAQLITLAIELVFRRDTRRLMQALR